MEQPAQQDAPMELDTTDESTEPIIEAVADEPEPMEGASSASCADTSPRR